VGGVGWGGVNLLLTDSDTHHTPGTYMKKGNCFMLCYILCSYWPTRAMWVAMP
jgi:hypothetical protein